MALIIKALDISMTDFFNSPFFDFSTLEIEEKLSHTATIVKESQKWLELMKLSDDIKSILKVQL